MASFRLTQDSGIESGFFKDIVVIIPALDEIATIGHVVRDIKRNISCNVVVVDDGSRDGTGEAALRAGAVVLPHTVRTGAWGAIRTGFRYADKHGYRMAVTMDGDGQHLSSDIHAIINPVASGAADVAIGACPLRASVARQLAWLCLRKLSGLDIADLTSGFRAYNREAYSMLSSSETALLDYQDMGVLMLLRNKGFTITEINVTMCPRASGHSRIFSSWVAVFRYLLLTIILCLAKIK
ncbi:MAG: glycosyltransferase family 2 protein [Desulfamplus sp.]|nr:glycosyltransferase family 2 protein [Desulfamplus sp.]